MQDFLKYLIEIFQISNPMLAELQHINFKKNKEDYLEFKTTSKISSILISGISKNKFLDFDCFACFGSLPYLKTILATINDNNSPELTINKKDVQNGNKHVIWIDSMEFKLNKKTKIFYQATNPINETLLKRTQNINITEWPVIFTITADIIQDFNNTAKIYSSAPNISKDRQDIFRLTSNASELIASFGQMGHQASTELTPEEIVNDLGDTVISNYYSIKMFKILLDISSKYGGIIYIADKVLKMEFETELFSYNMAMPAKIVME